MDLLNYIFLGLIQGIFEWLPISSQGSLVIFLNYFLNIPIDISLNYSVFLHLGTTFSAIIYFRKEIKDLFLQKNIFGFLKNPFSTEKNISFFRFLFISTFISIILGGLIYLFFSNYVISFLYINFIIGLLLIFTGIMLYFSKKSFLKKENLSIRNSFFLGLFQAMSTLPGISRSGMTTSVLLFEGFSAEKAFSISFLLSIPFVLIGEIGLIILNGVTFNYFILISIFIAFIVGYFTIGLLLKFAKKVDFSLFCFILGIFYIFLFFI
ncbi:MAG: undecaprenyl-diphosphate phosphatase [Candidatus ainarchaeum sp.]|nr:undecaprenyl-diphosphate phosphatase [Candidatus ainarchaeum sp.]